MDPTTILDAFGELIFQSDLEGVKSKFERCKKNVAPEDNPKSVVISRSDICTQASVLSLFSVLLNLIYTFRWGLVQTPVFNCLLLSILIQPRRRRQAMEVARWLIDAGVPVDGTDLAGKQPLRIR